MSELFEAPAVVQRQEIQALQDKEDRLLETVLKSGNIEVLERYIALRKSEQERQARLDFDAHFSEMQKDYVPVYKSKAVKNSSGQEIYRYCPIDDIEETYRPILQKHGFSVHWTEESISTGEKRIVCHVCGYGHERIGSWDAPIQQSTSVTNALQQRGVSTSYGKRYSLINALGIVVRGEDTDGRMTAEQFEAIHDDLERIKSTRTAAELTAIFSEIWRKHKDKDLQGALRKQYEDQKAKVK